ncbi:glycoside hydrolase family 6 protein [Streptomyces beijiangensis]|uniref:Glucanase n=1 Tax=Streptomyces beijiangensis TaxID=163361 RepID=A0A939FFP9_9ACTN|nr:glycoside hydrolase family 6 protein [Streptomyces beijiangensis]MBO0516240.1 glycoside hydrolase family 6 protein [Streptomyces beijiangensis]
MSRISVPPRRARTALLAAGALLLAGAGAATIMQSPASAAGVQCSVGYSVNDWGGGFTANVSVTNAGTTPIDSWSLTYAYAGNQTLTSGWSATWSQSGKNVTAKNLDWNKTLASGGSTSIGANFNYSGTNAAPTAFAVNGTPCNGGTSTGSPTPTNSATPTPTPSTTTTPPDTGSLVDNPFSGAGVYVNPEWSAKAAAEPGGTKISSQPTAVWLDRIAAIEGVNGGMGLRDHLDAAVQQAAGKPLVVQLVIYDLPGRDCAALASNGELGPTDLTRYENEYIDPITTILSDPAYKNLRIVNTIEPDSLPNMVTNVGGRATATPACDVMKANGNYIAGVGYALAHLGGVGNVYNYLDAGHHGWIGWDDNLAPTAQILHQAATTSGATVNNVQGFITNTANYGATTEPYFTIDDSVNGTSVRQSKWVDWNRYVDEQTFAQGFRTALVSAGFNSTIGALIDTSRNGWGGANRPTAAAAKTTLDGYVDGSRTDRRIHLGNWCNQSGAGIGERPKAAPAAGIDAYVWVKPPGESDGASSAVANDEGKGFDRMCDPTYTGNARNGNSMSGSLANAPLAGHWFSAQFQELLKNAYPAL